VLWNRTRGGPEGGPAMGRTAERKKAVERNDQAYPRRKAEQKRWGKQVAQAGLKNQVGVLLKKARKGLKVKFLEETKTTGKTKRVKKSR